MIGTRIGGSFKNSFELLLLDVFEVFCEFSVSWEIVLAKFSFLSGRSGTLDAILIKDFDFWGDSFGAVFMLGLVNDVKIKSESGFRFLTDLSTVVTLFVKHLV